MNALFSKDEQRRCIRKAKEALKPLDYDGILVSGGVSGMFGAVLASHLKKEIVVARKKDVSTASDYKLEGITEQLKLVFVDDLICSGETLKHCWRLVKDTNKKCKLVGAWLYDRGEFCTIGTLKKYGVS